MAKHLVTTRSKEPLNKSLVVAALVFRDELREASRVEW
jgi:hypothetical protein